MKITYHKDLFGDVSTITTCEMLDNSLMIIGTDKGDIMLVNYAENRRMQLISVADSAIRAIKSIRCERLDTKYVLIITLDGKIMLASLQKAKVVAKIYTNNLIVSNVCNGRNDQEFFVFSSNSKIGLVNIVFEQFLDKDNNCQKVDLIYRDFFIHTKNIIFTAGQLADNCLYAGTLSGMVIPVNCSTLIAGQPIELKALQRGGKTAYATDSKPLLNYMKIKVPTHVNLLTYYDHIEKEFEKKKNRTKLIKYFSTPAISNILYVKYNNYKVLLVTDSVGRLTVIDTTTNTVVSDITSHDGPITGIRIYMDDIIITCGYDGKLITYRLSNNIYNISTSKQVFLSNIEGVKIDGENIVVYGINSQYSIINKKHLKNTSLRIKIHYIQPVSTAKGTIYDNNQYLVSINNEKELTVWNIIESELTQKIKNNIIEYASSMPSTSQKARLELFSNTTDLIFYALNHYKYLSLISSKYTITHFINKCWNNQKKILVRLSNGELREFDYGFNPSGNKINIELNASANISDFISKLLSVSLLGSITGVYDNVINTIIAISFTKIHTNLQAQVGIILVDLFNTATYNCIKMLPEVITKVIAYDLNTFYFETIDCKHYCYTDKTIIQLCPQNFQNAKGECRIEATEKYIFFLASGATISVYDMQNKHYIKYDTLNFRQIQCKFNKERFLSIQHTQYNTADSIIVSSRRNVFICGLHTDQYIFEYSGILDEENISSIVLNNERLHIFTNSLNNNSQIMYQRKKYAIS